MKNLGIGPGFLRSMASGDDRPFWLAFTSYRHRPLVQETATIWACAINLALSTESWARRHAILMAHT